MDSDEEEDKSSKSAPSTAFKNMKRQAKIDIQRALEVSFRDLFNLFVYYLMYSNLVLLHWFSNKSFVLKQEYVFIGSSG